MRRAFASATNAPAYSYDPYGQPLQATAPLTDFVYAGMFYNTDSGLYLTQYRAYDPGAGRWLSRDPLGEFSEQASAVQRSYYVEGETVPNAVLVGPVRRVLSPVSAKPAYAYEPYGNPLETAAPLADLLNETITVNAGRGLRVTSYRAAGGARASSSGPVRGMQAFNLYVYVNGNPPNFLDPEGEEIRDTFYAICFACTIITGHPTRPPPPPPAPIICPINPGGRGAGSSGTGPGPKGPDEEE